MNQKTADVAKAKRIYVAKYSPSPGLRLLMRFSSWSLRPLVPAQVTVMETDDLVAFDCFSKKAGKCSKLVAGMFMQLPSRAAQRLQMR